jgi:hypothetical protein
MMNNAAVAVELYLKSLSALAIHTAVPGFPGSAVVTAEAEEKGHGLTRLLESIPDDVRKSLEEAYAAAHAGKTLRDALTPYQGLFAVSRYVFEKDKKIDKYPLDELRDLCSFLRGFTSNMKPIEWWTT